MDQDSSSNNSFDFNSQSGVMALLAAIRVSDLPPANKNELRDLVFLYTNGGGDVSVRIALEQKLSSYNIRLAAPKSAPIPAPVLPFGSSRPAPVFSSSPASSSQPAVTPVTEPIPTAQVIPPFVPTEQPSAPTPTPVTPQVQATPTPTPTPAPVPVEPPQPLPVSIPVPIPPAPMATQSSPVQQSVPVSIVTENNNYLNRIREIKAAVNSKVGNPVNLVDIDNQVGREYMNALLDAMKRLSGGAAGQDVAMQRLEDAYQAVEVAVFNHSQKPAPTAEPAPVAIVDNAVVKTPVGPIAVSANNDTAVSENSIKIAPKDNWPTPTPVVVTSNSVPSPIMPELPPIRLDGPSGFENNPSTPAPIVTAPVSMAAPDLKEVPVVTSLADETKKVLTLQDLPETVISAVGDPLRTREIDDGLEQLLSDWALFKKSGLFGTGPHGREHPLYKKISELPIPLLLTGRFEGSTQEIKQSITDYMNGWRYEQGIMYEQGETFEHYLRRVIRQILDLQKKRSPA